MLCGPDRSFPPGSNQATDPPPAPTVMMSTAGNMIGWPHSTSQAWVVRTSPSRVTETSVLVPPMSNPMTFGKPAMDPNSRAAIAPAEGPELAVLTGTSVVASTPIRPPAD